MNFLVAIQRGVDHGVEDAPEHRERRPPAGTMIRVARRSSPGTTDAATRSGPIGLSSWARTTTTRARSVNFLRQTPRISPPPGRFASGASSSAASRPPSHVYAQDPSGLRHRVTLMSEYVTQTQVTADETP
jgi:hypothetical protein